MDVWSFDLRRRALSRLTTDASSDNNPIWSPDGSRIVFTSDSEGHVLDLYDDVGHRRGKRKAAAGNRTESESVGLFA